MKSFTGFEHVFVDSWAWIALANESDPHLPEIIHLRKLSRENRGLWVTSDYVLDETITRLLTQMSHDSAVRYFNTIFQTESEGSLRIERVGQEQFQAAWRLRLRYADKPRISFTDLTSFVIMRESGIRYVLTGDAHFKHAGLGFEVLP